MQRYIGGALLGFSALLLTGRIRNAARKHQIKLAAVVGPITLPLTPTGEVRESIDGIVASKSLKKQFSHSGNNDSKS